MSEVPLYAGALLPSEVSWRSAHPRRLPPTGISSVGAAGEGAAGIVVGGVEGAAEISSGAGFGAEMTSGAGVGAWGCSEYGGRYRWPPEAAIVAARAAGHWRDRYHARLQG